MERLTVEYNDYYLKEYSVMDVDHFYKLYKEVHKSFLTKEHFLLKAKTDFSGVQVIGFIAYHKLTDLPAAFYGVYPCKIIKDGVHVLCAQSGDTLTHPDHRRKGLFEKLFEMTKRKCLDLGIKFLFGFPNSNSAPGFKKFGWDFYTNVKNIHLFHKRNYLERIRDKLFPGYCNGVLRKLEVGIEHIDQSGFQSDIIRTEGYIAYKANLSNIKFYKLSNCTIWAKIDKNSFYLGDLRLNSNSTFKDAAKDLIKFFKTLSFWNFYYSANNSNLLIEELLKLERFTESESDCIIYKLDSDVKIDHFRFSLVDFDTF
jgi:GNAT superfamily N-acetyltransferase